jgi:rhodanese-related sulfurtransferase
MAIILTLPAFSQQDDYSLFYQWPVDQYKAHLDSLDLVQIIDVRTPMEYKKGHVPGAVNISFLGFGLAQKIKKLDLEKPVFIYCQTAHRSPLAAKKLSQYGFQVINDLENGFKEWQEAGFPIEIN